MGEGTERSLDGLLLRALVQSTERALHQEPESQNLVLPAKGSVFALEQDPTPPIPSLGFSFPV